MNRENYYYEKPFIILNTVYSSKVPTGKFPLVIYRNQKIINEEIREN